MLYSRKENAYIEQTRITLDRIEKKPAVKTALAENSYDDARIQVGKDLWNNALTAYDQVLAKREEALAKNVLAKQLYRETGAEYSNYTARLRSFYIDDDEMKAALSLTGGRVRTLPGFISQATNFYNRVLTVPELLAKVLEAGILETALQASLTKVEAYKDARSDFVSLKGSVQELVVERDKAFRVFRSWMNTLIYTLRRIFKDNPQALESLGIFVRNKINRTRKKTTGEEPVNGTEPGSTTEPTGAAGTTGTDSQSQTGTAGTDTDGTTANTGTNG